MTVADAAQRSGMSEADLRAVNNIPPRMLIKAGSTLIVPRGQRVQEDVNALVADTGQLSFQPEIVTRRTVIKAGRADSVASIARRYKLNPASVAQWNDVKPNHAFQRGYEVVVYLPVRASQAASVGSGAGAVRSSAGASVPSSSTRRVSTGKTPPYAGKGGANAKPAVKASAKPAAPAASTKSKTKH
jgi:membrane-bound lytic murein transglycosylase D